MNLRSKDLRTSTVDYDGGVDVKNTEQLKGPAKTTAAERATNKITETKVAFKKGSGGLGGKSSS